MVALLEELSKLQLLLRQQLQQPQTLYSGPEAARASKRQRIDSDLSGQAASLLSAGQVALMQEEAMKVQWNATTNVAP